MLSIPDFFFNENTDWIKFAKEGIRSSTRGHSLKIAKQHCNLEVRRNVFSQRTVDEWNSLPSEVAEAPSLNAFKQRLDKTWIKDKYII